MKQIVQSYKTGEMALEEVPRPQVLPGRVLVETRASVISAGTEKMILEIAKKSLVGKAKARPDLVRKVLDTARREGVLSTLEKVRSKLDTPIPLGYSCAGVVIEVGAGVDGLQVGDPVACGGAGYANHAGFNLVPRNLCVRVPSRSNGAVPDSMSFEEAAFATVGAIALQGVRQAGLTLGERVCVIGLGLIGQLTVQICKASGCRVIGADIDPAKLDLAQRLGCDRAVPSRELEKEVSAFTHGVGADAVILTAAAKGSELIALAGEVSRLKGRVVVVGLVGMELPRDLYYKKELDLRLSMSYGPGRYDPEYEERGHDYPLPYVRWTEQRNMEAFLDLVADGRVDVQALISHRFPFDDALDAYRLITGGETPSLGVVLTYSNEPEPGRIRMGPAPKPAVPGSLGVGLIGAGSFAKSVLLPRLQKQSQVQLRGVVTARGMTAKAVAQQFGFAYCAGDVDEIFADADINTVLIATRHNLHGPLICRALDAGKHVFVEKPLCLGFEELDAIVDRHTRSGHEGRVLMVGFNRRFSPFIRRARDVLATRKTPLVASYRINAGVIPRDSWIQDPVEGGGRIVGEVCHFVDTLRFLVGAPVRSIQAASIQAHDERMISRDSVAITLTYADGSVGTILYHALGNPGYPKEKLEAAADGVVLVLDDYRGLEIHDRRTETMKGRQDKGFDAEIEAFMHAVRSGSGDPIPFGEIVETTRVTFAVHQALNTGETVRFS